jgi:multidrug efflux pump subunit AcrA (membrane-fusion protein)
VPPGGPGGDRRKKVLAIGLAVVVAASAAGWVAGRSIRSPAEVASRTEPPVPSAITAPVEKLVLTSDVIVRGTVRFGSPQAVTLPKSALKATSGIVSIAPVKGAELVEGASAMVVSGRPVFVLQGGQPAYRDLGPGDQGADVQQLEDALARLGFNPGARDGRYDGATAAAVAAWYGAAGYKPFGPTDEQLAQLRAAEADRFGVQSEDVNAQESLVTARGQQASAEANVRKAQSALRAAEEDRRAAQLQLDAARASNLNASEIAGFEAAVIQATSAIEVARADEAAARVEVTTAASLVRVAQSRVSLTRSRDGSLSRIVGELAGKLGIQVPADEVLFFPVLPVRVDEVTIKVGDETSVPVMTISSSALAVEGGLTRSDAELVKEGAPVRIEEADRGIQLTGRVSVVAATPGTLGAEPGRYYLNVTPDSAPADLVGSSVVMTISVGSTEGEVLVVPIAALSVAADGTSRVQVENKDGTTRYVTVRPGLRAKGNVAVTATRGRLAEGDLVIVGTSAKERAREQ